MGCDETPEDIRLRYEEERIEHRHYVEHLRRSRSCPYCMRDRDNTTLKPAFGPTEGDHGD